MPTATAEPVTVGSKQKHKKGAQKEEHGAHSSPQAKQTVTCGCAAAEATNNQHQHQRGQKGRKSRRVLGITLLALALLLLLIVFGVPKAAQDERVRAAVSDSMQRLNNTLVEHFDMQIAGFLERLSNFSDTVSSIIGDDGPRPGQTAAKLGMQAHHPVVIIPGFVTSGLELWQGEDCAQTYFRQRLWGTLSMAQTLLADRACWMRHMKLDPVTGSDPPGIKLRAAKALEAVDYFVPGYWVFSKMVQSLADLGYDNNNLVAVPYDWRLPIPVMETRDGYFTRVKNQVELQFKLSKGIKPVMVSHSYGAVVTMAFLKWVESIQPGWVDEHLHGYVNLAGPTLGLPKALSPLLSGETRETVDMMAGLAVLVEQYLGKQTRAAMFRTWGSVLAMLPVGGPKVWGNATHAPDDDGNIITAGRSYGGIVAVVRSADTKLRDAVRKNDSSLISNDSLKQLTATLSNWGNMVKESLGSAVASEEETEDEEAGNDKSATEAEKGPAAEKGDAGEAAEEVAGAEKEQVRFLDVHSAITSLALTAGEQLTTNLQRWSSAAQQLNLSHVLAHHRRTAAQLAAGQAEGSCQVDPTKPGDYDGTCPNADVEGSGAAAACVIKDDEGDGAAVAAAGEGCKGSGDVGAGASGSSCSSSGSSSSSEGSRDTEGDDGTSEVRAVNPVTTPLPNAPNFKLFCFYGVGTPTERGYHYLKTRKNGATEWSVNNMANDPASGLESGVQLSPDGDGTVPLLSLGALCAGGWKTRRLNPAGMEVTIREYPNNPGSVLKDARGGPGASTHVEILGNEQMLMDLMRLVSGQGHKLGEQYHTNIRAIASKIPWDQL